MAHSNGTQDEPAPKNDAGKEGDANTFGQEGTNKTQPLPDPNARPSEVGSGKFVESTPFTR